MRRMCSENGLTKKQLSLYLEKMKTIRYHIIAGALALLATGCNDDGINAGQNPAKTGDEVQFGLSLPGKDSRTVYGEEENNAFPIYWVDGDLVKVASPQCLAGRNVAEYSVSVENEKQNYATNMTRTGEYGVQWGEANTADFYSIYPSNEGTELNVNGETVTAKLHVDATQFANITPVQSTENPNTGYYYAQPAEMGNVVMYAKTTGVTKAENTVVKLNYIPFSTVLEFEVPAPETSDGNHQDAITIQSLTLTAPGKTIAGDFVFGFPTEGSPDPTVTPSVGGANSITMHFLENNQYNVILSTSTKTGRKQTLKAKMCLMPISGVNNLSGWTVEVNTSAGTFSKTLTDKTGELKPGLIHKVKLPKLSYSSEEWKYSLDSWIPTLPDYTNIYLSELSLPGAWYAGSTEGISETKITGYQSTSSISELWKGGVRAFGLECRTCTSGRWNSTPSYIGISGLGSKPSLADWYYGSKNITDVISDIQTALAAHSDEYAVLVLSYADGGEGGHRDVDHAFFLKGIANALSGYTGIIYDKPITANTTINDVKGKLIVKVNVDSNITKGEFTGMNALLSYNPFLLQIKNADYSSPYYSDLYWSGWSEDYKSCDLVANLQSSTDNASKFVWVFSSANRTQVNTGTNATIPTYTQRQTALKAMGDYSKQIYDASTHNVWFYFNCGGTQAESSTSDKNLSPTAFATEMNKWLLERINAKTDASPLGIVMFNQCTNASYKGPEIVKAIIEMNSKFYLKHAGTSSGSTGGSTTQTAQNNSTYKYGGPAF